MDGITIYTLDSKKMLKKNEKGWNSSQEQAKTYYDQIKKDDMDYCVKVTDKKEIEMLFSFISLPENLRELCEEDCSLLISVTFIGNDQFCMTFYFHPKGKSCCRCVISNYSINDSDYKKAEEIVGYINKRIYENKNLGNKKKEAD